MPGKISIGFGLLLIASIGQAFAAAQQDYDDCNQTSDLDRSIAACTRVVDDQAEATADRVTAYLHRGNDYIAAGKLDEAIADYGAAIGLDAKSMLAYAARAIAYWRKSDRDHAVADYRKAASMDAAGVRDMGRGNAELTTIRHAARDGACALATAHWYETTQKMATVTAYEDHLARFSVCGYAPLAQAGIAALTQSGSLQQIGNVDHARLGVLIASVTAEIALARGLNAARGALVSEPMPGGAALQAGVQKGDVIVAVDDDEVSDPGELSAMIVSAKPRASIRLTVIRA